VNFDRWSMQAALVRSMQAALVKVYAAGLILEKLIIAYQSSLSAENIGVAVLVYKRKFRMDDAI
jgi:hypothetical protein